MESDQVVVVGAGPSGLVAACGLLEAGVSVRVVDRATGPSPTSRALGLQPRGVEVLDRLDALGDLPQRSLPINQVIIAVDGREITRLEVGQPTPLVTQPGLMMSQAVIEAQLRARLRALGGDVEWAREIVAVEQDADGVTLSCADGEQLSAAWVVGCDGAHSAVRALVGIDFPGVPVGEQFLLADVHADLSLPRTAVTTSLHGAEMLGIFPLPGRHLWRLLAPWPASAEGDQRPDPDVIVARLTQLLTSHVGCDTSAVRDTVWASAFHIHRRLATSYRNGRVLLAGDAAHVHSPFGGQGMNTGMGDAENLAWKLALVARGLADPALLDTYEAERRPIATEVLSSTTSVTELMLGRAVWSRGLRDHVVVPVMRNAVVQRRIREKASQLKVSYRRGPLGASHRRRGLQPGDRVPDVRCSRADGTPTRLHAELRGRWALVGGGRADIDAVRSRLGADLVVTLEPLSAGAGPLLVRPDGHLACRQGDHGAWLDAALGAGVRAASPQAA